MIKPLNLKANEETQINLIGGTHANIENFGDGIIYVSKKSSIVPETDGVMTILGGNSKVLRNVATYSIKDNEADHYGTIYVLADSDTKIQIETATDLNFKQVLRGGGSASTVLDDVLKSNSTYQLGILTSDITITLPETATADIEVDFAIADTVHNINCDYLSLDVVANTYYQIVFSYDKSLSRWFASVISSDYISTTTAEVLTDETD